MIEPLLEELQNPDPNARERAVRRLRVTGGPRATAAVLSALDDPCEELQTRAAIALGEMEAREVVPALIERLRTDRSAKARAMCVFALQQIGDPRALEPFLAALSDPDEAVVRLACRGLAELRAPEAVEPLMQLLDRRIWTVREAACSALVAMHVTNDRVAQALERFSQEPEGQASSRQLRGMKRALLQSKGTQASEGEPTPDGARGNGQDFERALSELRDADAEMRLRAIGRLQRLRGPDAASAIVHALDDPAVQVRSRAALALGWMDSPGVVSPLVHRFASDDSPHVRLMCIASLSTLAMHATSLGSEEKEQIFEVLIRALAHPDWKIVLPAITGLGRMGDQRAVPALLPQLDDPRENVRRNTAFALIELKVGHPRLVAAFEEMASGPEAEEHDLAVDEWNCDLEKQRRLAREVGDPEPQPRRKMSELVDEARRLLSQRG